MSTSQLWHLLRMLRLGGSKRVLCPGLVPSEMGLSKFLSPVPVLHPLPHGALAVLGHIFGHMRVVNYAAELLQHFLDCALIARLEGQIYSFILGASTLEWANG